MSPSVIRHVIGHAFSAIAGALKARFLKSGRDNTLSIVSDQVLSGDDIAELAGGGSLYLSEVGSQ